MPILLLASKLLIVSNLLAQHDSLILNNGNIIVGEFKSMNKGVLQIATDYSDGDFKIKFDEIREIYSNSRFLFTTSEGQRYTGNFYSGSDGKIVIQDEVRGEKIISLNEIVYIHELDDSFFSRLSAKIDAGYTLTKANNQQQINASFKMGYLADFWSLNLYYNSLFSSQDEVEDIQRNDGGVGYRYFLPHDWYLSADITFLSNTEQSLALRTTGKLGAGKYIIHSNAAYWGFNSGIAFNNETFLPVPNAENPDSFYVPEEKRSLEGFFGTELNAYDVGDLDLFTNITAYPSFTEARRWRIDFRIDAKYVDFLLKNFYLRAGFTLNYDNQPAEIGKEVDYIFTTGFGWEL